MSRLTPTSYALLGLLSIAPMSGYDIHVAVDGSVRRFWPISKTQVYTEVARLEGAGLIEGTAVAQEGLPDKRVFSLTDAGERALDGWLEDEELPPASFRLPFLLKVLFGHRRDPGRTAELLGQVHDGARAEAEELERFRRTLETVPDSQYALLAVRLGERIADAVADWAKEAGALLPAEPVRIDARRADPRRAPAMFRRAPRSGRTS